jgi:DNA-binding response OmpR family regulator
MVVDDEHDLTLLYMMCLEYYGFEVEAYNKPRNALSSFKAGCYDLVILDIKMPDMDGFELYKEIIKKDPNVRVCFLTASELYHKEFRAKEYSTLDKELFIRKPIGNEELISKIKRLVRN